MSDAHFYILIAVLAVGFWAVHNAIDGWGRSRGEQLIRIEHSLALIANHLRSMDTRYESSLGGISDILLRSMNERDKRGGGAPP